MRGQDQYSPDLLIPERHDYSTSDPSDFPNQDQPRGITIDGELVADVPAAANGISIEEPQFVPNPSNDGLEVNAPGAPISFESSLLPNSPSPSVPPEGTWQPSLASESPKRSFLDKLADGLQIAGEIAQGVEQSNQVGASRVSSGNSPRKSTSNADCKADWSASYAAKTPGASLTAAGAAADQIRACEQKAQGK